MFNHTIPLPNSEPLFPLLMLHLLLVQFKKIHALFRRRHPLQRPLSPIQRHMLTSQQPHLLHSCVLLSFGATQNQVYHSAAHFATFLALFFFSPTNASNVTGTLERTPWWGKDPVEEDIMPRCFASLNAMLFRHLASRVPGFSQYQEHSLLPPAASTFWGAWLWAALPRSAVEPRETRLWDKCACHYNALNVQHSLILVPGQATILVLRTGVFVDIGAHIVRNVLPVDASIICHWR